MTVHFRHSFLGVLAVAIVLVASSFYLQYVIGLQPCALCYLQRYLLVGLAGICLIAALHNPLGRGRLFYALLTTCIAALGLAFGARQLWLQSLPADAVPSCLPSADFLLSNFPLKDALAAMIKGDGNCAKVQWRLLGLSIAHWTTFFFTLFVIHGGVWTIMHRRQQR